MQSQFECSLKLPLIQVVLMHKWHKLQMTLAFMHINYNIINIENSICNHLSLYATHHVFAFSLVFLKGRCISLEKFFQLIISGQKFCHTVKFSLKYTKISPHWNHRIGHHLLKEHIFVVEEKIIDFRFLGNSRRVYWSFLYLEILLWRIWRVPCRVRNADAMRCSKKAIEIHTKT